MIIENLEPLYEFSVSGDRAVIAFLVITALLIAITIYGGISIKQLRSKEYLSKKQRDNKYAAGIFSLILGIVSVVVLVSLTEPDSRILTRAIYNDMDISKDLVESVVQKLDESPRGTEVFVTSNAKLSDEDVLAEKSYVFVMDETGKILVFDTPAS